MKILCINNDGGGFADYVEVAPGTTVHQLVQQQVHSNKPDSYLIRVNRQPVTSDQVLQERDRVSFTPVKIEGAEDRLGVWDTSLSLPVLCHDGNRIHETQA